MQNAKLALGYQALVPVVLKAFYYMKDNALRNAL